MSDPAATSEARALARAAAAALVRALGRGPALRVPGERERHRELLAQAVAFADRALAALEHEPPAKP